MPKATKTPKRKGPARAVRQIVIKDCVPDPEKAELSISGTGKPSVAFFSTLDRDRVYEVKISGKIFEGHKRPFSVFVWYGVDPEKLTVAKDAKPDKHPYDVVALVGKKCTRISTRPDPPEIIVEAR